MSTYGGPYPAAALQRVTKYDGGFAAQHPAVLMFWAVVGMSRCSFTPG